MSKTDDDSTMFPEKWLKKLPTGFSEDADSMSEADLKKTIVSCENNIFTIEKEKTNDVKLNAAKEISKELSGPYRDAKSCQDAKIRYCLFLLHGKGADLDK
jgi:adenylate kinase